MKLIKKGTELNKNYVIHRKNRPNTLLGLWKGKHITDKNYILYEDTLFPINIDKNITLTIG